MSVTQTQRLVEEYRPFVATIARRLRHEVRLPCRREELVGYGVAGLLEAHRRFDPSRGVRFASFAYHRVRGAMLDGVRAMLPLPRRANQRWTEIARGLDPTTSAASAASVAWALGIDPDVVPERADDREGSIEEWEPLDPSRPELLTAVVDRDLEEEIARADLRARIRHALAELGVEERIVIRGMYYEERSLEDIGAELGISRSWACRIHTRALRRLRSHLDREPARRGSW